MKITLNKDLFATALSSLVPVAGKNLPVTEMVLINATDDIELTATNLDQRLSVFIKGDIQEQGKILIPLKKLYSVVASCPDVQVKLVLQKNKARITSGRANFNIETLDPDEFPTAPAVEGESGVVDQGLFLECLSEVSHAQSKDQSRFFLCGVHVNGDGESISFEATDGRRAARRKVESKGLTCSAILPTESVKTLERILGKEENAHIQAEHGMVSFIIDHPSEEYTRPMEFLTKTVEGKFPDLGQVFPKQTGPNFIIPVGQLKASVNRVALMAGEESANIRIELKDGEVSLHCEANGEGEADELISVEGDSAFQIAVNPRFLVDSVGKLRENVTMFQPNEGGPILVRHNSGFESVIMPVRKT